MLFINLGTHASLNPSQYSLHASNIRSKFFLYSLCISNLHTEMLRFAIVSLTSSDLISMNYCFVDWEHWTLYKWGQLQPYLTLDHLSQSTTQSLLKLAPRIGQPPLTQRRLSSRQQSISSFSILQPEKSSNKQTSGKCPHFDSRSLLLNFKNSVTSP